MEDFNFSDFFKTNTQATDFVTRLSSVSEQIYSTDFNLEKALSDQFGIQKKDKFMIILRDNKIPIDSNTALEDFLKKIREKISSMPIVSLMLAFEPKEETLKSISDWFPLNINMQVLLDIKVDPDIIGGTYINFNGKCSDFSIKPVFEQIHDEVMGNKDPDERINTKN
jgi:F0F1-type ATP synthase delta subunit